MMTILVRGRVQVKKNSKEKNLKQIHLNTGERTLLCLSNDSVGNYVSSLFCHPCIFTMLSSNAFPSCKRACASNPRGSWAETNSL